jgi:hypothetical protein
MTIQSSNVPEVLTLGQWKGLNQQGRRGSIDDNEEWWNLNLFAVGPGNFRSCWGPSAAIYTAPAGYTIRRIFFGYVGNPPTATQPPPGRLGWMFLDNGTAQGLVDQVDLDTGTVTRVGQIWQPIAPKYWADAVVWRPSFFGQIAGQVGGVLFGSPQGLYAWDGQTLTSPGEVAPDWLTDAAESPPLPLPGPTIMPSGLPGIYCMEVYESRLWVAGKDVISYSAPANGADFSTVNGGGSFGYFGNKLTYSFMCLKASSGYLFVFGDSSTDVISNLQMTGGGTITDPYTTSFTYQNVDPQVGQRFPRWVGQLGKYFTMYNGAAIFFMAGSDAQAIGQKVTNTYVTLDTSQYYPTMAPATMFGFRVMLCNGRFTDPWGVTRSMILMYHPTGGGSQGFWSVAHQNLELTHIGYYEDNSVIQPYGTDGTSLYRLFDHPDPSLPKRLSTKALRGHDIAELVIKDFKRLYLEVHDMSGEGWQRKAGDSQSIVSVPRPPVGVSFTGNQKSGGGTQGGVQDVGFDLVGGKIYDIIPFATNGGGIWTQIDLDTLSPDFVIERLHIAGEQRTFWGA